MIDRERKPTVANSVWLNTAEEKLELKPNQIEVGSGYTVRINRDENDVPVLDITTYGEVDTDKLRRELQRAFPEIHIRRISPTTSGTVMRARKTRTKRK
jgi:CYTH domain-containing protein